MPQVSQGQFRHSANAGRGVHQDGEGRLVTQGNDVRHFHPRRRLRGWARCLNCQGRLDRRQELGGLPGRNVRRLAFDHLVALCAGHGRRIDGDDVPMHQAIEESPQGSKVQLLGRRSKGLFPVRREAISVACRGGLELPEIQAHVAGHDVEKLEALVLGPGQEAHDSIDVVLPRVAVGEARLEEFTPGEPGGVAGAINDGWNRNG